MTRKRQTKSGTLELFAEFEADYSEASVDEIVADQKQFAKERLLETLGDVESLPFIDVADAAAPRQRICHYQRPCSHSPASVLIHLQYRICAWIA